jgi:hypothetical protein
MEMLTLLAPLDINELGELDTDELNNARSDGILPAEFDNEQLAQVIDYDELAGTEALENHTQDISAFDEDMARFVDDDSSELKHHHQNKYLELRNFELALGLHAHVFGINRTEYASLREIFSLLRNEEQLRELTLLPNQLSTLKNRISKRFPLMDMRQSKVPLIPEKLPTERAGQKEKERQRTGQILADLHLIDPVSLFANFVSSDVANSMHSGLALFVDTPTELFHSHSWASSARTTSGRFAHILDSDGYEVELVLPSEFICYHCTDIQCGCRGSSPGEHHTPHIGRVYGVGQDWRSKYCGDNAGDIAIQVQEAFQAPELRVPTLIPTHPLLGCPDFSQDKSKLILSDKPVWIPEKNMINRVKNISCDYYWGETMEDPSPAVSRRQGKRVKVPIPKYSHRIDTPRGGYVIQQLWCCKTSSLIPLCHTHPIRAELEIATYGRSMFEQWDDKEGDVISCPILIFIDGFGLYRNSYRSLIGVYAIVAGLIAEDRNRQANVFPLTLSPHGSNFDDTVKSLQSLGALDRGVRASIKGSVRTLVVPTLCYIGDMPQQDKNSGFRGPKAHKFCRFCYIGEEAVKLKDPNAVLHFDVVTHGRYHYQVTEMRREMTRLRTATARKEYGTAWGMGDTVPPLASITPALDLILSRPPDPAHSEYQGMSELMHGLLLDSILTEAGKKSYASTLRSWPFPSGWGRLQSPLHHFQSYSLASHARWSVIIPVLLRSWLRPHHIHPRFMAEAQVQMMGTSKDVVNYIVIAFARLAKSNSLLMGHKLSNEDRDNMLSMILDSRQRYQQLCQFASRSVFDNPRAWSLVKTPAPQLSVPPLSNREMPPPDVPLRSVETTQVIQPPKRATQYLHDMMRPNIHMGVHYPLIAEEYSLPVNTNTLIGENYHR